MRWKPEYNIGIPTIDEQHRTIFEHLLAIEKSIEKRDARDIQRYFYRELSDYMSFHFAVEEAMLDAIRFPGLIGHRDGHEKLDDRIRELEIRVIKSGTPTELVSFFEEWFVGHVLQDDRAYAAYAIDILKRS